MTAPTFVAAQASNGVTSGSGTNVATVNVPAGYAAGDLGIVFIYLGADGRQVTATPTGWTQVVNQKVHGVGTSTERGFGVFTRTLTASESAVFFETSFGVNNYSAAYHVYRGHKASSPLDGTGLRDTTVAGDVTVEMPSLTPTQLDGLLVGAFMRGTSTSWTPPAGMTERTDAAQTSASLSTATQTLTSTSATGVREATSVSSSESAAGFALIVKAANNAPNAPTLVSPVGGVTVDRTVTQRLDWDFSDPDAGDSQSKFDLRHRVVGAVSWTDVSGVTPNTYLDVASGTFTAGDYEWQVRTYDALGLIGPWSASGFFTAATPPTGPTITDPMSGQTVSTPTYQAVWSYPTQQAYQIRTVADAAGAPDTGTVYTDSGTVTSASARSAVVSFAVNNRTEHIQLRVQADGLWSPWASVRVDVAYTPPAAPTLEVLSSSVEAAISVSITNPPPASGEPVAASNDLLRRETGAGEGVRIARDLPANAVYLDHTPASGVDYEYAARAVGTNGSATQSAWEPGAESTAPITYFGGGFD